MTKDQKYRRFQITEALQDLIETAEEYTVAEILTTVLRRNKDPRGSLLNTEVEDKELYRNIYNRDMDDSTINENIQNMIKEIKDEK